MVTLANPEAFIIQTSMVGLGLIIAVYALVYPKIEAIMKKNAGKIVQYEEEFSKQFEKFKTINQENKEARSKGLDKLKEVDNKISGYYSPPYELFLGVIVAMSLFSIPLIKISFEGLNIRLTFLPDNVLINFVFGGVLASILLFFLIFVRLHSLVMDNLDTNVKMVRDETSKKLKEISKK